MEEFSEEPKMEKHPTKIEIEGVEIDPEELAEVACGQRYDKVGEFFKYLADETAKQSESDTERGRDQLSKKLNDVTKSLREAAKKMEEVWELCKPYMQD